MSDEWPVEERAVEFGCPWFDVVRERVRRPDGESADYYWVDSPPAVGVVAVEDGDVVLVEEYRPNQGTTVLAPPAGGPTGDESFEEAAARELREETGFVAGDLTHLFTLQPSVRHRQEFAIVLATDLTPGDQDLDPGEFIDVHVRPVEAALDAMLDGPTLGWGVAGLLYARDAGHL